MSFPSGRSDSLAGRVALVTGAGMGFDHGVGSAIATTLARAGARVWIQDVDVGRAEATQTVLAAEGVESGFCIGDVRDPVSCARFASTVIEADGQIDILVNSAGVSGGHGRLETIDAEQWRDVLDVNLHGPIHLTSAFIPHMCAARRGVIVNVASLAALRASVASFGYPASKAALVAFTRSLAATYGRDGIRANAVAPGHIFTPMIADRLDARTRGRRRAIAPLAIEGSAWDVAAAVLFLSSDAARFITGVCLAVDGGVSIMSPLSAADMLDEGETGEAKGR